VVQVVYSSQERHFGGKECWRWDGSRWVVVDNDRSSSDDLVEAKQQSCHAPTPSEATQHPDRQRLAGSQPSSSLETSRPAVEKGTALVRAGINVVNQAKPVVQFAQGAHEESLSKLAVKLRGNGIQRLLKDGRPSTEFSRRRAMREELSSKSSVFVKGPERMVRSRTASPLVRGTSASEEPPRAAGSEREARANLAPAMASRSGLGHKLQVIITLLKEEGEKQSSESIQAQLLNLPGSCRNSRKNSPCRLDSTRMSRPK
jgi:hypothetical protein